VACAVLLQSNWLATALNSLATELAPPIPVIMKEHKLGSDKFVGAQSLLATSHIEQQLSLEAWETFPKKPSRKRRGRSGRIGHPGNRAGHSADSDLPIQEPLRMVFDPELIESLKDFKVYIYDLPPAFNMDLVECYLNTYGEYVWNDENKERAQNTADIWMHELLSRYPQRTYSISEANVAYIPFYGFLSTHFSGIHDEPACNGLGHWQRAQDLAAFLKQSKMFMNHPAKHAMTISFWNVVYAGYPYWNEEPFAVATGPLYYLLQNVTLLVYEKQFGSFRNTAEYETWPSPLVTIPYVPSRQLAEATVRSQDARPIRVYFRGNLQLDSAAKTGASRGERLRQHLTKAFGSISGALLVDSTTNYSHEGYIEEMQRSVFCIVPAGDTPTSRRLFDAIAAGCVPVIVADNITLPFSGFIEWDSFIVRIRENDVINHAAKVTKTMLSIPEEKIKDMQQKLLATRDDFVYGRGEPQYVTPGRAAWNSLIALRESLRAHGDLEGTFA